jgi:DNA-binding transcriptional regulator GbsR (MarR family)
MSENRRVSYPLGVNFMSNITDPLISLKNDYLSFIAQTNKSLGYNPYLKGILFALMLEGGLLSQEQIMKLTGYSRSMVSETLTKLTDLSSRYPVREERIPGKKKKYYSCSLTFTQYTKILAKTNLESSNTSYDFIDMILPRLEALKPQTSEVKHVHELMKFLKSTHSSVRALINYVEEQLDLILETGEFPDFDPYIKKSLEENENSIKVSDVMIPESDDLTRIKRDFINYLLEILPPSGKQRDLGAIYFGLYLEHEPVTQEQLRELTGASRTAISEALTLFLNLKTVKLIKKPKDRKKYYTPNISMADYSLIKYTNQKRVFTQIKKGITSELLPALALISGSEEKISRFEEFLKENIRCYQVLEDFITLMFKSFSTEANG